MICGFCEHPFPGAVGVLPAGPAGSAVTVTLTCQHCGARYDVRVAVVTPTPLGPNALTRIANRPSP